MIEFYGKTARKEILNWFKELDEEIGTSLASRYEKWLSIMDATKVNYRREVPTGIPDCEHFLVDNRDYESWMNEDLYSTPPYNTLYLSRMALAEYDCGIAYYFNHRREFNDRLRKIEEDDAIDPADRYAGKKNPYNDIHIPFSSENQTAQMITDAKFINTAKKLRHKQILYDRIIVYVAVRTLGVKAKPVIDSVIYQSSKYYEGLDELKDLVTTELKKLEVEYCKREGLDWTDKTPSRLTIYR